MIKRTISKTTIGSLANDIAGNCKTIHDPNTRKVIETIYKALDLAHKEIESLKTQLNQQNQIKAD